MQLSLNPEDNVKELRIHVLDTPIHGGFVVSCHATSAQGVLLASSGLVVSTWEQGELLPILLSEVGYGWLTGGAKDMVTLPAAAFRARRKSLRDKQKWSVTPEGREALDRSQ